MEDGGRLVEKKKGTPGLGFRVGFRVSAVKLRRCAVETIGLPFFSAHHPLSEKARSLALALFPIHQRVIPCFQSWRMTRKELRALLPRRVNSRSVSETNVVGP